MDVWGLLSCLSKLHMPKNTDRKYIVNQEIFNIQLLLVPSIMLAYNQAWVVSHLTA